MSTKHTPGPFELDKLSESSWYICNRDKYVVCCVMRNDYMPKEEREANAALFLAAPETLAACKAAGEALAEFKDHPALAELHAAIAKAEPKPNITGTPAKDVVRGERSKEALFYEDSAEGGAE